MRTSCNSPVIVVIVETIPDLPGRYAAATGAFVLRAGLADGTLPATRKPLHNQIGAAERHEKHGYRKHYHDNGRHIS